MKRVLCTICLLMLFVCSCEELDANRIGKLHDEILVLHTKNLELREQNYALRTTVQHQGIEIERLRLSTDTHVAEKCLQYMDAWHYLTVEEKEEVKHLIRGTWEPALSIQR